jgi:hypothetical protein
MDRDRRVTDERIEVEHAEHRRELHRAEISGPARDACRTASSTRHGVSPLCLFELRRR